MALDIFTPFGLDTTAVSVSGTTASGALNLPAASTGNTSVRIHNGATVTVFIQFGASTVEATTSNMPIPAGGVEVFDIGGAVTHVAGITASGTGTLYATTGRGG